jgi:Natural resistance-associated macrophage protein
MYFIMLATAATLHQAGKTDIKSATDAAEALRPLAGDLSSVLLAVGLIGSGVLAVPILSGSAAYALSEAFGWRYGLDRNPGKAKQFYAVIVAGTLVGVGLDYLGINPIDARAHHARWQQLDDHGQAHEQPPHQHPRLGRRRGDVPRGGCLGRNEHLRSRGVT